MTEPVHPESDSRTSSLHPDDWTCLGFAWEQELEPASYVVPAMEPLDLGDGVRIACQLRTTRPDPHAPAVSAGPDVLEHLATLVSSGATPLAVLASLELGDLSDPETRRQLGETVVSMASATNAYGVPTVGGNTRFGVSRLSGPTLGTLCLGIMPSGSSPGQAAATVGDELLCVEPAEYAAARRSATPDAGHAGPAQANASPARTGLSADPVAEKRLSGAFFDLSEPQIAVAFQSASAPRIGPSLRQLATRIRLGVQLDLDRFEARESEIAIPQFCFPVGTPRALLVVRGASDGELRRTFEKWNLSWKRIGSVIGEPRLVIRLDATQVTSAPVHLPRAPVSTVGTIGALLLPATLPSGNLDSKDCTSSSHEPADAKPVTERSTPSDAAVAFPDPDPVPLDSVPDTSQPARDLKRILGHPTVASRNWISRQFDQTVGNNTVLGPGADAAVIRIRSRLANPDTQGQAARPSEASPLDGSGSRLVAKLLSVTLDGIGSCAELAPFESAKAALAEAARNTVCTGAVPVAAFASLTTDSAAPRETAWLLEQASRGFQEASRAFRLPVSWHATPNPATPPPAALTRGRLTGIVGIAGQVEQPTHLITPWFRNPGDAIVLLGQLVDITDPGQGLGGSAYLQAVHGRSAGLPAPCDLEFARSLHTSFVGLVRSGGVLGAHDCSDGGLAVALAECCVSHVQGRGEPRWIGASVDLTEIHPPGARTDAVLFGEFPSRIVLTCSAIEVGKILERAKILGVPAARIGTVGGEQLLIRTGETVLAAGLRELHDTWWNSIANTMQ